MLSTLLQHEECKELLDSPPMHIVSPEAIQEAMKEEKEEAMGHSQRRPFSRFASINALKQRIPFVGLPPSLPANVPITTNLPSSTIIPPISIAHSSFTLPNIKEEDEDSDGTKATVSSSTKARKSEKPKRPPNAYLLFNRDMRRKLLQTSPRMTVAEISKEIGDNWKVLPNDQRSRYVQEASILKQEHLKKHPDFIYTRRSKAELAEAKRNPKPNKQNSTSKQTFSLIQAMPADNSKSTLVIENSRRKAKRSLLNGQKDPRGRKKKRYKHPFAPKHPMSAYLHYLASVYPQVSAKFPGSTVGPISKSISRTWHAMSAEERLPWKQKADSDKARYAQEMKVYMAKNDLDKHEEKLSHASDEEEEEEGEANEIQYFHSQVFYRLSDEMNNKHVNLN
ncbi:High mobility group-T protein [Choanephora cucurbitarum]|uniref:High mobility group-T protein n=1 Tax=Choanephora cucurbitarum TaxID=101091 RepID=A0A1C7N9S4_9FUNG|nr:High mobility group-T protein [Choanephora cucurbitarum]